MSDDLFTVVAEGYAAGDGEVIVEWYEKRREVMVLPFNGNRDTAVVVEELTTDGLEGHEVRYEVTDHYARRLDGSVPLVNTWTYTDACSAFSRAFDQAAWNVMTRPRYTD